MTPFVELNGLAVPIEGRNIDTDQIIPARFLKKSRGEYADYLFYDLRVDADQHTRADFILNQEVFHGASILVCDENFGCGSSREAAVYALVDFGIKAILAPSYGDIFYNNCLKNGVLPVVLPSDVLKTLRHQLAQTAQSAIQLPANHIGRYVNIDLKLCKVNSSSFAHPLSFEIDPFWQECLIKGVDEIALTLGYRDQIQEFEDRHRQHQPWLAT
jgi:3-isopropylmalate/(R)-2-methylmalate dehydratase small subunit